MLPSAKTFVCNLLTSIEARVYVGLCTHHVHTFPGLSPGGSGNYSPKPFDTKRSPHWPNYKNVEAVGGPQRQACCHAVVGVLSASLHPRAEAALQAGGGGFGHLPPSLEPAPGLCRVGSWAI